MGKVLKTDQPFVYDDVVKSLDVRTNESKNIRKCSGGTLCERISHGEIPNKETITKRQNITQGSDYKNTYHNMYGLDDFGYAFNSETKNLKPITTQQILNKNKSDNCYLPLMWFSNLFNMDKRKQFPALVFESEEDGFVFSFNVDNISKDGYNANLIQNYSYGNSANYSIPGRSLSDQFSQDIVIDLFDGKATYSGGGMSRLESIINRTQNTTSYAEVSDPDNTGRKFTYDICKRTTDRSLFYSGRFNTDVNALNLTLHKNSQTHPKSPVIQDNKLPTFEELLPISSEKLLNNVIFML